MPQLPTPLRAALGLAASALEEARRLPDRAIELPMLAVSTALQMSLRAQQRYAQLAARGDDLLNGRETTDEPPPWATFDAPVAVDDVAPFDATVAVDDVAPFDAPAAVDELTVVEDVIDGEPTPPRTAVRRRRNVKPSAFDAIGDE